MPRWTLLLLFACTAKDKKDEDDSPDPSTDADADTDSDADTDTDADSDSDTDVTDCSIFPANNPWNTDIRPYLPHEDSDLFIDSMGRTQGLSVAVGASGNGTPLGIPYVIIPGDQPLVEVELLYADESSPGPYAIPPEAQVEGGPTSTGTRRTIALDLDNCLLYEIGGAWPVDFGASWRALSGAIFDLKSNDLRPDGSRSADPSGLPLLPGLLRYEEVVEQQLIPHALRISAPDSQVGFLHPATRPATTHTSPELPPMGLRLRLQEGFDCSSFSPEVQVICTALKTYGVMVADEGPPWALQATTDARWDPAAFADLASIPGYAFEAVYSGNLLYLE